MGAIATMLLSALLGGLAGYVSGRRQDEARAKERLRGVAGAMWADMQRIRQELGPPREQIFDLNVMGSDSIPPTIHSWIESLVPELANVHPDVLSECFLLERALHNHAVSLRAFRRYAEFLASAREELEAIERREGDEEDVAERIGEYLRLQGERSRRVQELEDDCQLWHDSTVDSRRRAHEIMDGIDRRLLGYLPAERRIELAQAGSLPPTA